MQQHIAPIVRRTAHNVGFSLVLTGWNELYGARRYRLGALWPHTKIDVLGFDVYNQSGVVRNGTRTRTRTDFLHGYFTKLLRFARSRDVAWGLAETGHTDWSARTDPGWVLRTYRQLVRQRGIAFSYFNTRLHSIALWRLVGAKGRAFARALRSSPTM